MFGNRILNETDIFTVLKHVDSTRFQTVYVLLHYWKEYCYMLGQDSSYVILYCIFSYLNNLKHWIQGQSLLLMVTDDSFEIVLGNDLHHFYNLISKPANVKIVLNYIPHIRRMCQKRRENLWNSIFDKVNFDISLSIASKENI